MASSQITSSHTSAVTVSKNCLPSDLSNSVVVSNNLLQLIRDIPPQNSIETSPDSTFAHLSMDELLMHLKNYIIKHNLYDQKNPLRILLKESPLGLLLGKTEFSLLQVRDILFEKLVCPVNEISSEDRVISHSDHTINDKMCVSKKRKLDYIYNAPKFSAKKRNTRDTSCSSDERESMHSCQEYETEFVKDSDADSVIDGVIIAETYDVEYEIETPEGDELSCESDSELEDIVKSAIINFIARSSDSDIEYLADESSEDESHTEKEIPEEDKWHCFTCDTINDPLMRHCACCWSDRVGWLSERSVCSEFNMDDPSPQKEKERNFVHNPRKEKISVRKSPKRKLSSKKSPIYKDLSNRKLCSSGERSLSSSSHTNDHDIQTPSSLPMQEADKDHIPKTAELDKPLCLFCCTKPANSTIIHGHWGCQVSCFECGKKLMKGNTHGARQKRCPVCRRFIEKIVYCYN